MSKNEKNKLIKRTDILIEPDLSRVLIRFFSPNDKGRITRVIARITSLKEKEVIFELEKTLNRFGDRHLDIKKVYKEHYKKVKQYLFTDIEPSENKKLLIGAYLTSEYSLQAAAVFNPSIVPHPEQNIKGSLRFIMSLRSVGEGHISSIEFREGSVDNKGNVCLDSPENYVIEPKKTGNPVYDKYCFSLKLYEIGHENEISKRILENLFEEFTFEELVFQINLFKKEYLRTNSVFNKTAEAIFWLAESNYEVCFDNKQDLSTRVISPLSSSEHKAIEDARFVLFTDDNGSKTYYATYTAFNGSTFLPQLMETKDFLKVRFITLNGEAVKNKGLALFPRKINGQYAMLGRQDNENIYIMYSDNIHFWHETKLIMKPSYPWEYTQLGNCGSPIETDKGWLVLTHGVGAMRRYCIGAVLLDIDDPSRIIGRMQKPLLEPEEDEREGYVPNVVYSCGALKYKDKLILPFAVSDYATRIAIVDLNKLLDVLQPKSCDGNR